MALFLSVEPGDSVRIGDSLILFERKSGRQVRVRIDSALDIEHTAGDAEKAATPQAQPPARATPSPAQPKQDAGQQLSRSILLPQ